MLAKAMPTAFKSTSTSLILIGVLADQQLVRLRRSRADQAKDNLRAAVAPLAR